VGKMGWKMDVFKVRLDTHPELNKRLFWLNGISDAYLEKVYGACRALIAASVAEGFGLPLIEAAQKGLPVLARDIPVFREVGGTGATYFGGSNQALEAAISAFLADSNKRGDVEWLIQPKSLQQSRQ